MSTSRQFLNVGAILPRCTAHPHPHSQPPKEIFYTPLLCPPSVPQRAKQKFINNVGHVDNVDHVDHVDHVDYMMIIC